MNFLFKSAIFLYLTLCASLLYLGIGIAAAPSRQPNLLFVMADDYGWNDVSWHNSQMHTPTLHHLATHHAVILNQSYVLQVCSPTRSAFMTGYYPYHIGTQNRYFTAAEPSGVPLHFKFIPETLKEIGYKTYMVGKWHLGFCKKEFLPTNRGFDKYFGYYTGSEDYWTHRLKDMNGKDGLDFWKHKKGYVDEAQWGYTGNYSAEVFADEAISMLQAHNKSQPFFLYLAFQSVHAPLQVPDKYMKPCNQSRQDRRTYCGMVNAMDTALGKVLSELKNLNLYDNTIIMFNTDNGGETLSGGNNWPLRGNKRTLWEGGTRAISFVHSPKYLKGASRSTMSLFHITDWYSTIYQMAKYSNDPNVPNFNYGDGIGQWAMIRDPGSRNLRTTMVYNIDVYADDGVGGYAIRDGRYKYISGYTGPINDWVPPERGGKSSPPWSGEYLFDIINDPTERQNLDSDHPRILDKMKRILKNLVKTSVPTVHRPDDPRGFPEHHNGTWASGWC